MVTKSVLEYNELLQNVGHKTTFLDRFIEIINNNTHVTIPLNEFTNDYGN